MAKQDYDIKKDFDDSYQEAISYWSPAFEEMYTDSKSYLGDQWSSNDKAYMAEQGRSALVYNYAQRNVHLNSGYQRKNRKGFGLAPQEDKDTEIADYLQSALIWQANKIDFYNTFSDGFEDSSITGINLISYGLDYANDPNNGKIYCGMESFQSMIIDPLFTRIDLSDARYVLKRKYISKTLAKCLLPNSAKDIDKLPAGRIDNKFDYMAMSRNSMYEKDIVAYDEYYLRSTKPVKILTHQFTGEQIRWQGDNASLKMLLEQVPYFRVSTFHEPTIEYNVMIQHELMYNGKDPLGINDYPCTPLIWIYKPQHDDFRYKIQGMIRAIRDPSTEYNRMRSKVSDIINSQGMGLIYEEGALKNEEDAYKTGQGGNIVTRKGRIGAVQNRQVIDVPMSITNLVQQLNTDLIQIPGLNESALGVDEGGNTEVSGVLSQQRANNSVTVFQTIYDKLNLSQKICGEKLLKIMLANYTPEMWQKITGKPFPQNVDINSLADYDVVIKQTQLTDTQKILGYYQGLEAKKAGVNVPDRFLIEEMPIADITKLKEIYTEEAQQSQMMQEQQQKLEMVKTQALIGNMDAHTNERQARAYSNLALSSERTSESEQNRAQATLDRAKTMVEVSKLNDERILKVWDFVNTLEQQETIDREREDQKVSLKVKELEKDSQTEIAQPYSAKSSIGGSLVGGQ